MYFEEYVYFNGNKKKIYIVKISGITAIYYRINLCSHQPHRSINNNYSAHVKAIWWVNSGL